MQRGPLLQYRNVTTGKTICRSIFKGMQRIFVCFGNVRQCVRDMGISLIWVLRDLREATEDTAACYAELCPPDENIAQLKFQIECYKITRTIYVAPGNN